MAITASSPAASSEKGREYLAEGDLHQASGKGWGAAAWKAKAVAETQGWEYGRYDHCYVVLRNASRLTGNGRLLELRGLKPLPENG